MKSIKLVDNPNDTGFAMKISTRGRYAARLMLDLAVHYGEGFVHLKDVARRQEISRKYLGHLIPPLKKAGLITSNRGAHGGYRLARAPRDISLGEVVRAVEGDLAIVECVATPEICHRVGSCVTRDIWELMGDSVRDLLDSITLEGMVDEQRRKQELQGLMWHI
jgi:Rrf2 family cysteine metabolism transcriptional repressor